MADFLKESAERVKRGIRYMKSGGLNDIMSKVRYRMNSIGAAYDDWFREKHEAGEDVLAEQRQKKFAYEPKISILVPVYMTPEIYLRDMIESVLAQTYSNWELQLVDGSRANDAVEDAIYVGEAERIILGYKDRDKRIHYHLMGKNMGISGNTNVAMKESEGEYIALLDHDDVLTPDALYCMVSALQEEHYDVLYSDEDKMTEDGRRYQDPLFKPDFSIDLIRSYNYINNFLLVKRTVADAVDGFHSEFDGAEDYDFILRVIEKTKSIRHVPRVLYHWRINGVSSVVDEHKREYQREVGRKALAAHLAREQMMATVEYGTAWGSYKCNYDTPGNPLVSVIIPGGGNISLIRKCVRPLYEFARYSNFEIVLVDPGDDSELSVLYHKLERIRKNMRVVDFIGHNEISGVRNFGVSYAKGDYLLFLDPNVEILTPTAIGEMLGNCMRPEVSIVGATLYNDREVIASEGVAVGVGDSYTHLYKGVRRGEFGYRMHNLSNGNYSAVSCACMMIKREAFARLGGFSEKFTTEYSDIDFCLRAGEQGMLITCAADAGWYLHKGTPRGEDREKSADELLKQRKKEKDLFDVLWTAVVQRGDPFYNTNFNRKGNPFSL